MPSAKATRNAAQYLREFMRANTTEWGEMMRQSSPNQGWGDSDAAYAAHEAAMFLDGETDQHFLDFVIPGNFASGEHLLQALRQFRDGIVRHEVELQRHREEAARAGASVPGRSISWPENSESAAWVSTTSSAFSRGPRNRPHWSTIWTSSKRWRGVSPRLWPS